MVTTTVLFLIFHLTVPQILKSIICLMGRKVLLKIKMTVFSTLLYTPNHELPPLSYTYQLIKVPTLCRASPNSPIQVVATTPTPPPPSPPFWAFSLGSLYQSSVSIHLYCLCFPFVLYVTVPLQEHPLFYTFFIPFDF